MTEDEAKTKWCPFARVGGLVGSEAQGVATNRWPGEPPAHPGGPYLCIASECMAWRWIDTHVPDPANPGGELIRSTRRYGACGLAGPWFQNYGQDQAVSL